MRVSEVAEEGGGTPWCRLDAKILLRDRRSRFDLIYEFAKPLREVLDHLLGRLAVVRTFQVAVEEFRLGRRLSRPPLVVVVLAGVLVQADQLDRTSSKVCVDPD